MSTGIPATLTSAGSPVMSVIHVGVGEDQHTLDLAQDALVALAERPGYLRGSLARTTDDSQDFEDDWVLVTEWRNIGSYRRALGAPGVKRTLPGLQLGPPDLPTSFEQLLTVDPGGEVHHHESDRA